MATARKTPLPWTTVYANTTGAVFFPATPWMDASEIEEVRVIWELRAQTGGITNGIEVAAAFQAANSPSAPDTLQYIEDTTGGAQWRDTNGVHFAEAFKDVSASTGDKQYARYGWATRNQGSGGTTVNPARVSGTVFSRKK